MERSPIELHVTRQLIRRDMSSVRARDMQGRQSGPGCLSKRSVTHV